jgi:hypothetical protein
MKGDIAFAGFLLTADEWKALDEEMRAQLIAIATRRADPWFDRPVMITAPVEPLAEGSGPLEIEDVQEIDAELLESAADILADPMAGLDEMPLTRAVDRQA